MAKDIAKVAKRSAKKAARLASKSAKRLEDLMGGPVTGDKLADALTKQWTDMADTWLSLFAAGDAVPRAFMEVGLQSGGTGPAVMADANVTLDDPVGFALLTASPLNAPGSASTIAPTLADIDGTTPGPTKEMEELKVKVTVPGNQPKGLYHGFVATGSAVVVEVYVNVRWV